VRSEMNAIVGVYEIRWTPRGRQLRQIEPALSAAGLLAMKIRGVRGVGYGNARISLAGGTFKHHLGDVMAAWLAALDSGRTSARSSRPLGTSNLVQWQKPGGDWPTRGYDGKVTGPVYATASTLLALTAADHRLAFLQQKRR